MTLVVVPQCTLPRSGCGTKERGTEKKRVPHAIRVQQIAAKILNNKDLREMLVDRKGILSSGKKGRETMFGEVCEKGEFSQNDRATKEAFASIVKLILASEQG